MFRYKCLCCDEWYEGMPSLSLAAPLLYQQLGDDERHTRGYLGTDDCVVDETHFFVRGCLEVPIHGEDTPLTFSTWASLSPESYEVFADCFHLEKRSHIGPFFGWFSNSLPFYPETLNLKASIQLRDDGIRPLISLEPTDHPLSLEQKAGISMERAAELLSRLLPHA